MAQTRKRRRNGNTAEASLALLQEDLSTLQADVGKMFSNLGGGATDSAAQAMQAAGHMAGQVETLGQEGVDTMRSTIRTQPLVACAIAAGAGALLGAIVANRH